MSITRRSAGIPEATVARLPVYLRVLNAFADANTEKISSEDLAAACGVSPAKLRKDLSFLGTFGTRGVGYEVALLAYHIGRELGQSSPWGVVIVGVGNLGHALVSYRGFASRGFRILGLLDASPQVVGQRLEVADGELEVQPLSALESIIAGTGAQIGVIATPAEAAQEVCDRLVGAGVRSILNFAPALLEVPADVEVRKVDLATELQILAFHEQRRGVAEPQMPGQSMAEQPLREAMHA